jgi:hypothetical protein
MLPFIGALTDSCPQSLKLSTFPKMYLTGKPCGLQGLILINLCREGGIRTTQYQFETWEMFSIFA